jgi:hypothetical protein
MSRRSGFENSLLDRVGRSTTSLTVDDIAAVIGDALKDQRKNILAHVGRLFRLQELNAASSQKFASALGPGRKRNSLAQERRLAMNMATPIARAPV